MIGHDGQMLYSLRIVVKCSQQLRQGSSSARLHKSMATLMHSSSFGTSGNSNVIACKNFHPAGPHTSLYKMLGTLLFDLRLRDLDGLFDDFLSSFSFFLVTDVCGCTNRPLYIRDLDGLFDDFRTDRLATLFLGDSIELFLADVFVVFDDKPIEIFALLAISYSTRNLLIDVLWICSPKKERS